MNSSRFVLPFTALVAVLSVAAPQAQARPPFTAKEGKPCGYCHVNPGGGGKRNYRGNYYGAHDHTFAEFDDAAEAKKASEEVGPDPDPTTKPKSWTAPKAGDAPKPEEAKPVEAPKQMTAKEAAAKTKVALAAYTKNKKDPALTKAYAAALADQAHATMLDQSVPRTSRYKDALKLDAQALKLDPSNKMAAEDKKVIEDAYKSMGKPVPKV